MNAYHNQVPEQTACPVRTNNLRELLVMVNRFQTTGGSRETYDLKGREVRCPSDVNHLFITASNVTLTNGVLWLGGNLDEAGATLFVKGSNVELNKLTLKGGKVGLSVRPGGGVTIRDCEIQGSHTGLTVGKNDRDHFNVDDAGSIATLVAFNLKIKGFFRMGMAVLPAANVQLTDCEIGGVTCRDYSDQNSHDSSSEYLSTALSIKGPDSQLTASNLWCKDAPAIGVGCFTGGRALLERCKITSSIFDTYVIDRTCVLELWYCQLTRAPLNDDKCYIMKLVCLPSLMTRQLVLRSMSLLQML